MDIVTVVGTVVCTRKDEKLGGYKLLLVADPADSGRTATVAVDTVGAGVGECVILVRGSSARTVAGLSETPVDAVIVGIVDHIEQDGRPVYHKGAAASVGGAR